MWNMLVTFELWVIQCSGRTSIVKCDKKADVFVTLVAPEQCIGYIWLVSATHIKIESVHFAGLNNVCADLFLMWHIITDNLKKLCEHIKNPYECVCKVAT